MIAITKKDIDYTQMAQRYLEDPNLWDNIQKELDKVIVKEGPARSLMFVCACGSLVENSAYSSFNLLIHSKSSAGKDYTVKNVLKLFPHNKVHARTRISPTALNYWKPFEKSGCLSWDQSILYLSDVSESILNSEALKLMCSEGSFITVTAKDQTVVDIEIKGKPIIFCTTATSIPNEEIMNRFSIIHLDESPEQTKRIKEKIADKMIYGRQEDYSKDIRIAMGCLQSKKVFIPFAHQIIDYFPDRKIGTRRNMERFFDYMKALCVLYQLQREEKEDEEGIEKYLIATWEDYDRARELFNNVQSGISDIPFSPKQEEIIKIMNGVPMSLSLTEIHGRLTKGYITLSNLRPHIDTLVNLNVLERYNEKDALNREILKYKLSEEFIGFKPLILPSSEEIIELVSSVSSVSIGNVSGIDGSVILQDAPLGGQNSAIPSILTKPSPIKVLNNDKKTEPSILTKPSEPLEEDKNGGINGIKKIGLSDKEFNNLKEKSQQKDEITFN